MAAACVPREKLERIAATIKPLRMGVYARSSVDVTPIAKHVYVRSEVLLERVRQLRFCCFCCCSKSVMPCHSNFGTEHKGGGIKADDNMIAAGCMECHHELDQGKTWTYEERRARFYSAVARTVLMLQARGDWPKSVPLPTIPEDALA